MHSAASAEETRALPLTAGPVRKLAEIAPSCHERLLESAVIDTFA